MANKNCMVYETLGKVSDLEVLESATGKNEVRLHGVFGVCGVRNNNRRIYNKENYGMMVEALQNVIATEGCPGELEHPNTMNITLENVSHKIESIEMNEDGTITGTILLLNTPKGKIAQAIVESGLPLYISSRGAGSIDDNGNVTLTTIKTYDLVGTPGFSQAKLTLKENQTYECLNESAEDGNIMYAIVENDEFGHDPNEKKEEKPADPLNLNNGDSKDSQKSGDDTDEKKDGGDEGEGDDTNNDDDINMKDLKAAIDKLTEKVTSLEAELHVAKESLEPKYAAIEQWIKEEFAPEFKKQTLTEMSRSIEGWICEEFAPEVQSWVCEEFAPEVQNWVCEEFAPEVQGWVCEEFAPTVEGWINEELIPETSKNIQESVSAEVENKVNENVNAFIESQKTTKLSEIDALLESLDNSGKSAIDLLKEHQTSDKYAGVYVIENMPAEYQPSWNTLDENRKDEIIRQSRAYDFTKEGVLESFWAAVDFAGKKPVQVNEGKEIVATYHNNIAAQMMRLRHTI